MTLTAKPKKFAAGLPLRKRARMLPRPTHIIWRSTGTMPVFILSFCLRFQRPLDWTAFGIWLAMLLHCHGSDILRVKGLLNIGANSGPVFINGVQHLVHPPDHLSAWPDDDRSSRVVFIVRGLSRDIIERSLAAFALEAA